METALYIALIAVAALSAAWLLLSIAMTLQEGRKKAALLRRLDEMTAKLDEKIAEELAEANADAALPVKEDLEDDGK